MADLTMRILLSANDSASKVIQNMGQTLGSGVQSLIFGFRNLGTAGTIGTDALYQGAVQAGTAFWKLGLAAGLAGGVIAVKFGIDAVKAAGDFQGGMTSLVTGAGELESNLKMVSDGVLQLSIDTATSTKQLTSGMYMIESAGYHGADGLNVLKIAAEGAKVGNADLGATANALTTILTDYHLKSTDAAGAMNALTATVASGKTHLQDLASSMGSVLPLASSLGISFPQVAGAIAVMTNSGMNAQRAAQNLANTIRSLAAPNSAATKSMKEVGLSAQQLHDTLSNQGLAAAIQEVSDAVGKKFPAGSVQAVQAFKAIMGGATGYNVSLMLGGKNMAAYQANIKNITGAMQSGKTGVTGWAAVQQDFNFKLQQAQQAFEVLKIKIGQQLLPVVSQLLTQITPLVLAFAQWLVKSGALQNAVGAFVNALMTMIAIGSAIVSFFQNNQVAMALLQANLIVLAVIVGVVMVIALYSWAAAAWVAAAANIAAFWPVYLVVLIIIVIIAVVILVIQHWGQIAHWLQGVWSAVASWFVSAWGAVASFFVGLWKTISTATVTAWNALVNGIKGIVTAVVTWLETRWQVTVNTIVGYFTWLYNHNYIVKALVDAIAGFFKWIHDTSVAMWNAVASFFVMIWNAIKGAAVAAWNWIMGIVTTVNKAIQGFLMTVWNAVATWFAGVWNTISSKVSQAWGFISGIFGNAWNTYIAGPLGGLWNQLTGWFGNLATAALNAGKNLMQQLASGITGAAGVVGNAIHSAIGNALSVMGFHGIPGFATGVQNFKGGLAMVGENGPELMYLPSGSSVYTQSQMQSIFAAPPTSGAVAGGGGGTQIGAIHVYVNSNSPDAKTQGQQVAQEVQKQLAKMLRGQAITPRLTSGGTH